MLGNYVLGQPMAVVQPARWQDTRCHRSAYAPAARAALEAADPHTSVTFLSFACSGATINRTNYADQSIFDPYRSPQAEGWTKFQGSGILGSYAGAVPPNPDRPQDNQLPSQIDQVVAALTNNGQIATTGPLSSGARSWPLLRQPCGTAARSALVPRLRRAWQWP